MIIAYLLLQGCHHPKYHTKPTDVPRLIDLTVVDNYQLNGKMSFSNGQDGGSGSVHWQKNNGLFSARIKAPLGSKSWRVSEQITGAELIADGAVINADSAQILISNELGWPVPWEQLKFWVIGQPYNKTQAQINWQKDGFILSENGWLIEYSRLKSLQKQSVEQLPHKMIARKGNYSIKLSIKQWIW